MSVNKVILIGRLGSDPTTNQAGSSSVTKFSLATSEKWMSKDGQKQEKTEWHNIVAWGKTGEICQKFLSKGKQVYVEGKLTTEKWEDKEKVTRYSTKVYITHVTFLDSGEKKNEAPQSGDPYPSSVGEEGRFF